LVNYCSKFIPNFSTITAPLRKFDRKKVPWTWDASHQEAFDQFKSSLSEQCTLAYYDPNRSTSVVADASPVGLGAILVQHDEQGILKVIAFASRALTVVEQRYCQTEQEALACVWACEKFHLYLVRCQFTLYTDHQALEILYSAKAKQSARIQRWALRLQQYNYTVKYRSDTGNPADFLSRAPINEPSGQSITEEYINFITEQAIPRTITLSEVQEATKNDKELQSVGRTLQFGNWKDKSISAYFAVRHEITSVRGVLLDKEAEQHVKECLTCQISGNPEPPPPLAVVSPPMAPWSCIHVDFYGPAPTGEHLLVMLDETTGFPEVEIMNKTMCLPDTDCQTNARRRTRKSSIKEGDTVLVKQKKKNKYTTMFRPQPYKVINVRYSRVTAQRGDHVITRNVSHFKKFNVAYRETVPNPESEDDITIAAPQAGQDNDQDIIEDRYPLRANRGVPPDFYGR
ncbi:Hypothetical predicted protein, partial [Paramuricea clavata]